MRVVEGGRAGVRRARRRVWANAGIPPPRTPATREDLAHGVLLPESATPHRGRVGRRERAAPVGLPRTPRVASDGAAGLLASGSSYSRAFPPGQPHVRAIHPGSGDLRFRPRLQWRGPRRLHTGFPFQTSPGLCAGRERHRTVGSVKEVRRPAGDGAGTLETLAGRRLLLAGIRVGQIRPGRDALGLLRLDELLDRVVLRLLGGCWACRGSGGPAAPGRVRPCAWSRPDRRRRWAPSRAATVVVLMADAEAAARDLGGDARRSRPCARRPSCRPRSAAGPCPGPSSPPGAGRRVSTTVPLLSSP